MSAQIRRHDMKAVAEFFGHPVPVAAMIPSAMDEQQWRRAVIAPIDIMQAKALGKIELRSWA
jgi:hypothetical protein